MIDMLLFLEVTHDYDAIAQDIEMVTYDLERWYMLPWDKDTTFGMYWDGTGIKKGLDEKLLIDYEEEKLTQKPWYKTYHAFKPEVEKRYKELRDGGIFTPEKIYKLAEDINNKIPKEIWEAEIKKWETENRPSLDETSVSQIISWFTNRLAILDKHFNYK